MTDEALIEELARALCEAYFGDPDELVDAGPFYNKYGQYARWTYHTYAAKKLLPFLERFKELK